MRFYIGFLVLASACTGSIGGDTGGGDDDNPPVTPPPTDVQLVIQDGFTPQANVRVLFQNSDNTLIAEVMTDATGLATSQMPNGGNLTVIRTFPVPPPPADVRPPEIYNYIGVKAGDRLKLGHDVDDTGTPSAINVKVPTAAEGTVSIVTPCGSGQGTAPLIALTVSGCPDNVLFYVADQNDEAFVTQAAYSENIDLSQDSLATSLATTLSATGVTTAMSSVEVETRIMDGTFELYASTAQRVDTTPASVNLPNLSGVDELVVATIAGTSGTEMVATRQAYVVSPTTVDAASGLIPYVKTPTYAPTGISWLETGTGSVDFVLATLDVTPAAVGNVAPPVAEYIRAIIAPHVGTSLVLPMLSGADAIYNPAATDQIVGKQALVAATGGYDAARVYAFSVSSLVSAAPMSGAITMSYAGNTPPSL